MIIAMQRLDKQNEIRASNNTTEIYSSLLGNNQRAGGLQRFRGAPAEV
jgi:hypothetical protein